MPIQRTPPAIAPRSSSKNRAHAGESPRNTCGSELSYSILNFKLLKLIKMINPWRLSNSSPSFTPNCQEEVEDASERSSSNKDESSEILSFSLNQSSSYLNQVQKPARILKPIVFNDSILSAEQMYSILNQSKIPLGSNQIQIPDSNDSSKLISSADKDKTSKLSFVQIGSLFQTKKNSQHRENKENNNDL
jgi:hypothetical protein